LSPPKKIPEFQPNHVYRIAYRPVRHAAYHNNLDVELACPQCGASQWSYHITTGTKKLDLEHMKFRCVECNQWFICNRKEITKILGL
jgi:hypothetical protein